VKRKCVIALQLSKTVIWKSQIVYFAKQRPSLAKWQTTLAGDLSHGLNGAKDDFRSGQLSTFIRASPIVSSFHFISLRFISFHAPFHEMK
jgi:hypothetical protein